MVLLKGQRCFDQAPVLPNLRRSRGGGPGKRKKLINLFFFHTIFRRSQCPGLGVLRGIPRPWRQSGGGAGHGDGHGPALLIRGKVRHFLFKRESEGFSKKKYLKVCHQDGRLRHDQERRRQAVQEVEKSKLFIFVFLFGKTQYLCLKLVKIAVFSFLQHRCRSLLCRRC